jgi:hypothetical protein
MFHIRGAVGTANAITQIQSRRDFPQRNNHQEGWQLGPPVNVGRGETHRSHCGVRVLRRGVVRTHTVQRKEASIMFRMPLAPMLAATCLTLTTSVASAQSLLNPLTWFGPQRGYGNNYSNCPNGNCGINAGYRGGNCPGGNCALPGACANGQCGLPNNCPNGVCPTPGYGGYPSNYRPQPYSAPQYNNVPPYNAPQYNTPSPYVPYSAQRQVTRKPAYDRSVMPAGGFDWNTPTTARRPYAPSNSPFYP